MDRWRLWQAFWINLKRLLSTGNHDFCPGVNRYVYWLKRPIGWLLTAAAAAALVGVSVGPQGWVVFGVILAVILLGVAWPAVQMWASQANLVVSQPRGMEGQPLRITLRITNHLPFPLWGLMIGERFLQPTLSHDPEDTADDESPETMAALARVPAWSITEFHWDFPPTSRGHFPRSGARLATGFPFGVWQSSRWITCEQTAIVWPHVPQLRDALIVKQLQAVGEQAYEDRAGEEGDFLGLRAYRDGDALRKIHWPQTVRSGNLVVRESEKAVNRQLTILVDVADLAALPKSRLGLTSSGRSDLASRDTEAEGRLRVALSLIELLWNAGFSVRLQLGFHAWEASSERRSIQVLMDAQADWSWPQFFERWQTRRTINLRPDFVVGGWDAWHHDSAMVRQSEPAQGMIFVHRGYDYRHAVLRLSECCSPKFGVPCWQTTESKP